MSNQYQITRQDQGILNLISHANGISDTRSRYNMINGQASQPVDQMTIEQVLQSFTDVTVGAYSLTNDTLSSFVESAGINRTLRFTPAVQDFIALSLILTHANYDQWKSGSCSDSENGDHDPRLTRDVWSGPPDNFNHAVFLLNLCKIFPSLPIPIRLNEYTNEEGTTYSRPINSSYYGEEDLAKGNSRTLIMELKSIFSRGSRNSMTVSLINSQAYVPSSTQSALNAAGGGQDYMRQARPHANNDIGSLKDLRAREPRSQPATNTNRAQPSVFDQALQDFESNSFNLSTVGTDTITLQSFDLNTPRTSPDPNAFVGSRVDFGSFPNSETPVGPRIENLPSYDLDAPVEEATATSGPVLPERSFASFNPDGTLVRGPRTPSQADREAEVGLDAFGGAGDDVPSASNPEISDSARRRIDAGGTGASDTGGTGGAGGGRGGDPRNFGAPSISSPVAGLLPDPGNPYEYQYIDPLDNRYDFRTGKKVIDLLINGTASAASYANDPNARRYGEVGASLPGQGYGGNADARRPNPNLTGNSPRTPGSSAGPSPYDPIEFNTDAYIVRNIIENPVDSNGNVVVIATPDGRVAELEQGQVLFTSPGVDGAPGETITISSISPGGAVTLSNGETLNRVGQYGDSNSVIGGKINDIAPADEEPAGEYLPIRGSIENDIALLNALVQEETSYVRVIPIDIGDGKAHYVSSGYYRDSRGDWPYTALSPRGSATTSRAPEFAVQVAQRLNGSLPPREVIQWIETEANVDHWLVGFTGDPDSDSTREQVNNRIREEFRSRGIQPGELVAGHKKSFDKDGGFWGLAKPEGGIYQNGGAFSNVHSTDYTDYSHGTRIYWGGIDLESGERFGPVQLLRSGSPQIGDPESWSATPPGEQPSYMNDSQWELLNRGTSGQDPTETVRAVEEVATELGVHPSAIMGKLQTESALGGLYSFDRLNSGTFRGAWQAGRGVFDDNGGALTSLDGNSYTFEQYSQLSYADQIRVYPSYLRSYNNWNNNLSNSIGDYPPDVQFAVLQGLQFAPNGSWVREFDNGVYTVPTTRSQQSMSASTGTSINGLLDWWDRGFSN